ncbi:MAG: ribulokinase, partial [Mesorhizobium sp.]
MTKQFVCAVDVGTGSARAGILDTSGILLGRAERPIAMNRPRPDHAEHDSRDIWSSVCTAVRAAREKAGVAAEDVVGISFDATCSLVVRDRQGGQLSVSVSGDRRWDTIVWLDHRAIAEADECTASGHAVLDYIGGVMSPEMATPKLMWLKRNLAGTWNEAGYLFDLTDFLTWQATGSLARSQCTLT